MIQARTFSRNRPGPGGALRALPWLFLTLFSFVASAAGGGGDTPPTSSPNVFSSPGDEVTSLPIVQDATGLTFLGSLPELRSLDASFGGRGRLQILELPSGAYAVTVLGNMSVELDRGALAHSGIEVFFRGGDSFRGGVARLQILDSRPVFLETERVPLPLGRLASTRIQGDVLALDLLGPRGNRGHVDVACTAERVTLLQRVR